MLLAGNIVRRLQTLRVYLPVSQDAERDFSQVSPHPPPRLDGQSLCNRLKHAVRLAPRTHSFAAFRVRGGRR